MAGWTSPDREVIIWDGTIKANKFAKNDGTGIGDVASVFGRTGAVVAATNDYTWGQIEKTTSDIADITTRSHASLTSIGTNTHAQIDTHIASGAIHSASSAIMVVFQGASGALIASGSQVDVVVPFSCKVKRATMLGDASGTAIVEIWRDSYANFPPTGADRITGPGIRLSGTKTQDTAFASWSSTTLNVGEVLRFNASGATTTINRLTVALELYKSG